MVRGIYWIPRTFRDICSVTRVARGLVPTVNLSIRRVQSVTSLVTIFNSVMGIRGEYIKTTIVKLCQFLIQKNVHMKMILDKKQIKTNIYPCSKRVLYLEVIARVSDCLCCYVIRLPGFATQTLIQVTFARERAKGSRYFVNIYTDYWGAINWLWVCF